jgi:tetratricopeptide (TPR) repeat protein
VAVDATYDVFVSYAWADRHSVTRLAQALRDHGLRVFVDDPEVEDFARITTTITQGLAASRVLLAYYSQAYPTRRACQWELTAAYLAASRAGDPTERILVVNPEPAADHLYPGELRDALFRRAPDPNDQPAAAKLAEAVAEHVRGLPGPLGAVAPLAAPRWLPTPGLGSTRFVGRLPEMWRLHSALHPETTRLTVDRTGPAVVQVRGLGGLGKSLLAEEYALRFGAAYPGGVLWLRAYGSHDQIDLAPEELEARRHDELRQLARGLALAVEGDDPDELPGLLAAAIQEAGQPCLWVVDDLPKGLDGHQVRGWLAPHPLACSLLTTRSQAYGALAASIDLDVLDEQDAYELLITHRRPTSQAEAQAAKEIVAALGRHALAVDVAGAGLAIQQGLVGYTDFLQRLSEPDEDELELIVDLADALPNGHEASIARTLLRSISQLGAEGQDFLRLAASLAPAPIPADLIRAVFAQADGLDQHQATRHASHAVNQAAKLSLASKASGDEQVGMWLVHALVARTVRYGEPDPERLASLRQAAITVLTQQLQAIVDARAHSKLQAIVSHARELARNPETLAEVDLLGWVARYDYLRGEYRSAEQGYRQQWHTHQRLLGPDRTDTLGSMSNLAETLRALGDLAGARDLHQQVLDTSQRVLGPDHPDIAKRLSDLANVLYDQRDRDGALSLRERALAIYETRLGPDHPDTARGLTDLGGALRVQDTWDALARARTLLERALAIYEARLGPHHPDTARALNNLALVLRAQGALPEARSLHKRALAIRESQLGIDHPDTASSLSNLALVLRDQGKLASACTLHERALRIREDRLGPNHPLTARSIHNVANILRKEGDLPGARALHERALGIRERRLGPNHSHTARSLHSLAGVLKDQGDLAAARDLYERALRIREDQLGPNHRETVRSRRRLAAVVTKLEKRG